MPTYSDEALKAVWDEHLVSAEGRNKILKTMAEPTLLMSEYEPPNRPDSSSILNDGVLSHSSKGEAGRRFVDKLRIYVSVPEYKPLSNATNENLWRNHAAYLKAWTIGLNHVQSLCGPDEVESKALAAEHLKLVRAKQEQLARMF